MGKKELQDQKANERVEAVLKLLRKQAPLTAEQEKFCNNACVERFLRAKGDNVKKSAKHLRACLSWRESIGLDNLTADEFSAELVEGVAFVAGNDEESRPVLVFRIKQDYQKFHSQKMFTRLLVFTVEVAIGAMSKNAEQLVMLFDASKSESQIYDTLKNKKISALSENKHAGKAAAACKLRDQARNFIGEQAGFFRSASALMNLLLAALKIAADFYPGRLFKAFVIDPPSLFSYLWKGVRPFVELSTAVTVVSSMDFEDSLEFNDFSAYPRASSLRFDTSSSVKSTAKIGSCSSSRFSFTVSHHFDSQKPWYLSLTDTSSSKVEPTNPCPRGPALVSSLNARSLSFASPAVRAPRGGINGRQSLFPSTPLPQRSTGSEPIKIAHPRTPRPSNLLQSPAMFFRKDCHVSFRTNKSRESFLPFVKFYRRPYDEVVYRSKMRPPLGGLISIVSPYLKRRPMSEKQLF